MRTDCPHCGKRIRWWHYVGSRAAPGERRVLPNRAITVCPRCRADIATNIHPLEKRFELIVVAPIAIGLAVVFALPEHQTLWLPILAFALLFLIVACVHFQVKTRDWQRFRRHDGE